MSKEILNMKNLYSDGNTKFCFLIGKDIQKTLSPSLHNQWFQQLALNSVYLPCHVSEENEALKILTSLLEVKNFLGANITKPFKNTVLQLTSIASSPSVIATNAANTVFKNSSGHWQFENTDIIGIKKSIESLFPFEKSYHLIVIGGGGAASSCLYYAEKLDVRCDKIFCFTRSPAKTLTKFPALNSYKKLTLLPLENGRNTVQLLPKDSENYILINALPPLTKEAKDKQQSNLVFEIFTQILLSLCNTNVRYFDLNYIDSGFDEILKEHKLERLNGAKMLEEQAKESFFLWTQQYPS